ncbi:MAG: cation:proton antiporter [DPANN group archaeon]|nr:cation:proton antiporter [DPANN group archaeon]
MILVWYIILASAILVFVRFLIGPTFADRMVALDVLGQMMILFFVFLAIVNSAPMYLDIALTFSLLLFIGTVAVSKWIKGKGKER